MNRPVERRRLNHGTVVAYLALFVALGGVAIAAGLPKNSVGPKQLKKKAVTTPKLKDGAVTAPKLGNGAVTTAKIADNAVTGAKVDEASLSQVPSAAVAGSASSAADAATLGGTSSDGFLRTSDVVFGNVNPEVLAIQPILSVPAAFNLTTSGNATPAGEYELRFQNISSATWFFHSRNTLLMLGPTGATTMTLAFVLQETIVAYDSTNPAKHVVIECAVRSGSPDNIFCTAQMSPAL
jgi:hypothetical protein